MIPDYTEDVRGAMVFGRGPPPPEQADRIKPGPLGMYRQKFFVPRKSNVCFQSCLFAAVYACIVLNRLPSACLCIAVWDYSLIAVWDYSLIAQA